METDSLNTFSFEDNLESLVSKEIGSLTKYHVVIIKKNTQIYFYDKSIYYFKISDVSSELHSLSSFHLYNIIHKKSYFCQGGYRDKLQ